MYFGGIQNVFLEVTLQLKAEEKVGDKGAKEN